MRNRFSAFSMAVAVLIGQATPGLADALSQSLRPLAAVPGVSPAVATRAAALRLAEPAGTLAAFAGAALPSAALLAAPAASIMSSPTARLAASAAVVFPAQTAAVSDPARAAARRPRRDAALAAVPTAPAAALPALASMSADPDRAGAVFENGPDRSREISPDWVRRMSRRRTDAETRTARETLQRSGFNATALNKDLLAVHNDRYTHELAMGPITDQKSSGRCWIFAGLNMLRSSLIARGLVPRDFEFSENFLHFFNMLEKSNRHLEEVIDAALARARGAALGDRQIRGIAANDLGDGGWFEYFLFLVAKYGLVPKSAMGETVSSQATSVLLKELSNSIAESVAEILEKTDGRDVRAAMKTSWRIKSVAMRRVWNILAAHLGTPPDSFEFDLTPVDAAHFTPRRFAKSLVGFDPEDYVVIANFPRKDDGAVYEVKDSAIGVTEPGKKTRNIRFMNVSAERLEQLAVTSLEGGEPLWFSADVGRDVDNKTGIMHPGVYSRDKAYGLGKDKGHGISREWAVYLRVTRPNHAMLLSGFDRPDRNGPVVKFKVENSWGANVGAKGVYHMYREWMRENVYQIIVHKRFLTDAERKSWGRPATMINGGEMY